MMLELNELERDALGEVFNIGVGQAAAALIGYTALRYMGELHIKDCVQVCLAAQNLLAGPSPSTALSR